MNFDSAVSYLQLNPGVKIWFQCWGYEGDAKEGRVNFVQSVFTKHALKNFLMHEVLSPLFNLSYSH